MAGVEVEVVCCAYHNRVYTPAAAVALYYANPRCIVITLSRSRVELSIAASTTSVLSKIKTRTNLLRLRQENAGGSYSLTRELNSPGILALFSSGLVLPRSPELSLHRASSPAAIHTRRGISVSVCRGSHSRGH